MGSAPHVRRPGEFDGRCLHGQLIPGQNDGDANYRMLGEFLLALDNVERIEILCYHPLAESKYECAGVAYTLQGMKPPAEDEAESRRQILLSYGLSVATFNQLSRRLT